MKVMKLLCALMVCAGVGGCFGAAAPRPDRQETLDRVYKAVRKTARKEAVYASCLGEAYRQLTDVQSGYSFQIMIGAYLEEEEDEAKKLRFLENAYKIDEDAVEACLEAFEKRDLMIYRAFIIKNFDRDHDLYKKIAPRQKRFKKPACVDPMSADLEALNEYRERVEENLCGEDDPEEFERRCGVFKDSYGFHPFADGCGRGDTDI